ncbi:MAG: hypothetical protein KF682_22720 [Nitrospira sp.]|nr:hypothetical protein [Nitrospira sp.]
MTQVLTQLPPMWRRAPRRWGHELHSLCSYMAMFPPMLPRVFIEWLSKPGDVVYDPFSGRGTTLLESLLGLDDSYIRRYIAPGDPESKDAFGFNTYTARR